MMAQITNAIPIVVNNAQEALGALLHYEFPNISFENAVVFAGGLMGLILAGSRYLRKIIPDSWQVNNIGLALAHIAGEVNPSIAKLSQAAASPTAVPMEQPAAAVPVPPPAASLTPPPNVAAPKTVLAVAETGQQVVPEPAAKT